MDIRPRRQVIDDVKTGIEALNGTYQTALRHFQKSLEGCAGDFALQTPSTIRTTQLVYDDDGDDEDDYVLYIYDHSAQMLCFPVSFGHDPRQQHRVSPLLPLHILTINTPPGPFMSHPLNRV